MTAHQQAFPFPSIDFEDGAILSIKDIARKLGVSTDLIEKHYDLGLLKGAINLSSPTNKSDRRLLRFPVEVYRNYILQAMEGDPEFASNLLTRLPRHTLLRLVDQANKALNRPISSK